MHSSNRRAAVAALLSLTIAPLAWSEGYPAKPITLVVPYPAGAAVDNLGRALALELGKHLGQPVIVENVGGASGTIGAARVRRSAPDGYTLMIGTVNDMVVAPTVMKSGYTSADFTAIARISSNSTVIVAHPSLPANSVDELIALARRNPEPLLIGASGAAVMQTIGGILVADAASIKITNVTYKGGAPLLADLRGGQVKVGTLALNTALPQIREGSLKALAVISAHRDPTAPDIPTVNESNSIKGVEADLWTGLLGPAKLPLPVVTRLSVAMRDILADPQYREAQFKMGSIVAGSPNAAEFSKYILREQARLGPVLANLKTE